MQGTKHPLSSRAVACIARLARQIREARAGESDAAGGGTGRESRWGVFEVCGFVVLVRNTGEGYDMDQIMLRVILLCIHPFVRLMLRNE
jgi:hypothetical protein